MTASSHLANANNIMTICIRKILNFDKLIWFFVFDHSDDSGVLVQAVRQTTCRSLLIFPTKRPIKRPWGSSTSKADDLSFPPQPSPLNDESNDLEVVQPVRQTT